MELVVDNTGKPIDPNSKLAYALKYAAIGWHVFPVHYAIDGKCSCGIADCKNPAKHPHGSAPFGQSMATTDGEQIKKWWTRYPDCNIGVLLSKSELCAIDIDPRNGGHYAIDELEAKHGPLDADLLAFSGGGGEHRIYWLPSNLNLPGKLGKGIDVKVNGYILVEPSNHISGGHYAWEASSNPLDGVVAGPLPDWLRDLTRAVHVPEDSLPAAASELTTDEIEEIKDALTYIDSDDRDIWLQVGMAIHNEIGGSLGFDIWSEWSMTSAKFHQHDQLRVWRSFKLKGISGITKATLFKLAYESGYAGTLIASDPVPEPIIEKLEKQAAVKRSNLYTPAEPIALPVKALQDVADYFSGLTHKPTPAISTAGAIALGSVVAGRMYVSEEDNYTALLMAVSGQSGIGKNYIKVGIERLLLRANMEEMIAGNFYTHQSAVYTELRHKPTHICISDEFGENFMEARKSTNANKLTVFKALKQAFSDAGHIFKADSFSKIGKAAKDIDTTPVRCPSLTLIGLTTPLQFYSEIKVSHIESGLINRFVIVNIDSTDRLEASKGEKEPSQDVIDLVKRIRHVGNSLMTRLFNEEPVTTDVRFSKEAKAIFAQAQIYQDAYAESLMDDHLDAMPQRWREIAMRLATLFAVFDNHERPVVSGVMAQWAVDYVFHHGHKTILTLRNEVSETEYERQFNKLLAFIKANPGCSETKINNGFKSCRRARKDIMAHLQEAGLIVLKEEKTATKPRKLWFATEDAPGHE